MFVTSFGPGVRGHAEKLIKDGEFLKAHIFQALALETAEAYAEFLHSRLRAAWGFADADELSRADLFKARYHGKRYSFGYPACPRLEDQSLLFEFLDVSANLGVELTEGFMMEPESSVSAVVFHHPEASYFSLNEADSELLDRILGEPPPGA
jgi:5-methyltetrahydrofolate--homocysteine methyltransferase